MLPADYQIESTMYSISYKIQIEPNNELIWIRKLECVCNSMRANGQCMNLLFPSQLDDFKTVFSEVLEVLSHVLQLTDIDMNIISTIIKSVNNIISVDFEVSEYEGISSSLTLLINTLFHIQVADKHRTAKEVLLSRIVFLFNTVITKSIWKYMDEEVAWNIFYFYFYVYRNVHFVQRCLLLE